MSRRARPVLAACALAVVQAGYTGSAAPVASAAGRPPVQAGITYGRTALGTRLRLDLFRPAVDSRRAAVIWLHGSGPSAPRSRIGYYASHFAELGYLSATIDYSQARERDAMKAVRWFRERAASLGVRPDRIFVGGYSSGAIAAVRAAEQGSGLSRPDGAVSISGYGAQSDVARSSAPLLMIHGDRDRNVPIALARRTCTATIRAGVACSFLTLHGAAHSQVTYSRRFTIWPAVDSWLRGFKSAPAPAPDPTPAPAPGGTGGTPPPA